KVRIVAPIPGKGVVGFEVPNAKRQMVFLQEIIASDAFRDKKLALPMALGKDIHGNASVTDLAKMPHLLVAGTTGSGKSVGVNCMITSLLYHASPDDVRFIMVDPKMLELSIYEGVPHLLLPVVTDSMKASLALKWAVDEMERRYAVMKNAGVRSLRGFNRKVLAAQTEGTTAQLAVELGEEPRKIPYIVVVIDEFADLMMVAGKEVEYCVARIAQKARAAGIHLILATQRPSTDVITGVIKANFPTRIAFRVSSGIDSRTILSTQGAENLLGKGDMLFLPPGTSRLDRVHGAFVSEEEIHQVVDFIKAQRAPDYLDESILTAMEEGANEDEGGDEDTMYEEAVRTVLRDGRASTSHLQRRLSLGYNRAARIVDQMERDGLVGGSRGSKPREINKQVMAELVQRWDET
ncbi:MAG: S-DNA-T family DNA segregation ATPase FtsK/SpoIIIE, partial [Bradymonadia bacterium]